MSNWRRRHDSFPSRIGGTDVSPQFSLAEVERWPRKNGKLKDIGGREFLWPRFEALGSREESGLAIAEAARRMRSPRTRTTSLELSAEVRQLVGEAAALGRAEGPRETFEFLLQRWLGTHVPTAQHHTLATLMTRAALAARIGASEEELTVLDPACGTGHLAAASAQEYDGSRLTVLGCERNPALAAPAAARLGFATKGRDVRTEIVTADALREDPFAGTRADIALCNPPFNERDWGYQELGFEAAAPQTTAAVGELVKAGPAGAAAPGRSARVPSSPRATTRWPRRPCRRRNTAPPSPSCCTRTGTGPATR
ncbi:N-6 DNA methylase [Streptomyces sp. NPDC058632]|uniref:N-6 DNA methylase n=1 Tax=unclassified Streptomyces TaxID=2593676 RepID=UPI00365C45E1